MDFTVAPNKDYRRDLEIISEALSRNETLSFSKFCDGEWAVMENQKINNKEFWFDPEDPDDAYKREKLIEAFQYQNDQYFVGISCAGVFGEDHSKMKKLCGQPAHRLTWADLWVNSNYSYYLDNVLPLFADRKIVLYCNSNSMTHNLPFTPEKVFPVSYNAWANDWDVIEESKKYIGIDDPERRMERITYHGENIQQMEQSLQRLDPDSYREYVSTKPKFDTKILPFKELNAEGGIVGLYI